MIAIIPARGGSKGLPGKNIKKLLGKPLIAYTIEAALKSKTVSDIIVSTDCKKIASVAVNHGAKCPFMRPAALAKSTSNIVDAITYTITKLHKTQNYNIEEFILLQPTSPLRIAKDIDNAVKLFKKKKANAVISVTQSPQSLEWFKYLTPNNKIISIYKQNKPNRQDYKKIYYTNGAVYVFNYGFFKKKSFYSDKTFAYIMPRNRSVDIDTMEDFLYAQFLLNLK